MFTSKIMVIRMSKMIHLMYFLLNTEKNRLSLGKIIKCIWKVIFGPFTKYYGLLSSVLPLANCQHFKIWDFTQLFDSVFFFFFFIILFLFFLFLLIYVLTISQKQLRLLNIPFSSRTRSVLERVRKDIAQPVTKVLLL